MDEDYSLEDFHAADDEGKKAIMFESLMRLLTAAIADGDDIEMIKGYARLVTEIWNSYDETYITKEE
jgi:hypothetical protein